jgi:hypothetical protein
MCLYDPLVVYQQLTLGSSAPDLEVWETRHNFMLEMFSGDSALRIHDDFLGQVLGYTNACGIEIQHYHFFTCRFGNCTPRPGQRLAH